MRVNDQDHNISCRLAALSIEQRSRLDRHVCRRSNQADSAASIAATAPERSSSKTEYPLSFAQQRLWFLDRLEPGNTSYNMPAALRIRTWIDAYALKKSINGLIARHAILRTTFHARDEQVVQRVHPIREVDLPIVDLSTWPSAERETEAHRLAQHEAAGSFFLEHGPLIRAKLIRLSADDHVFLVTVHHIVSDGWSFEVLFKELNLMYEASVARRELRLPELKLQYHDYALQQRQELIGEKLDTLLGYWTKRLADAPKRLNLPSDRSLTCNRSLSGAEFEFEVARESIPDLDRLCKTAGVTRYMLCLAVFEILLYRYSRQSDYLLGTAVANRGTSELEALIGFFVNTLVLRADLSGRPSFYAVLQRVRRDVLSALEHQDLPFERLVEELRPERTINESPLFQIMFVFHSFKARESGGSAGSISQHGGTGTAKFDLSMMLESIDDRIVGAIEYRTDLYEPATIARLAEHYVVLLAAVLADPEASVDSLTLMQAGERTDVLNFGRLSDPGEAGPCLHEILAEQARRRPDQPALRCGDERLSYAELDRRSDAFARELVDRGIGRGDRVALCFAPSFDVYVAIFGVLKTGAAFVPLDPRNPSERLCHMLDNSEPRLVIAGDPATQLPEDNRWERLEFGKFEGQIERWKGTPPATRVHPDDPAYIIYTSGTTGPPKGVLVPHRGLWNVGRQQMPIIGPDPERLVLQFSSLGFDASIFELCMAIHYGGCLVLLPVCQDLDSLEFDDPEDWKRLVAILPPPVVAAMGARWDSDPGTILFAGETLPANLARRCLERGINVFNAYGPTETTIWASVARIRDSGRRPVIGRPIEGVSIYILDEDLEPVPIGIPGTLWIGGPAVATGYVGCSALTAERFMPDPFSERPGSRMYCSGDLGRFLDDGSIDFLGRIDHQVKVRGFRIEIGEVEAAINTHPAVCNVVVAARGRGANARLCAWLSGAGPDFDPENIKRHVATILPNYMLPSSWVLMDRMPLNASGKIDHSALTESGLPARGDAGTEPETELQGNVATLFAGVLDLDGVGLDDDFFRLGGHSLLAIRLLARLRASLGVKISLRDFFSGPTVRSLAEHVELSANRGERHEIELVAASRSALSLPLSRLDDLHDLDLERFFQRALIEPADDSFEPPTPPPGHCYLLPASYSQQRVWFVEQLDPGQSFYNIPLAIPMHGAVDTERIARALTGISKHQEALRTSFVELEGQPLQVVRAPTPFEIPVVDVSGVAGADRMEQVQRLIADEARLPFDLSRGPLLRAKLLRLSSLEHVFLLTMHHIVSDGWSMVRLLKELDAFYKGDVTQLAPIAIQFGDYALYERRSMGAGEMSAMLAYWKERLSGIPATLDLPFDRPRPEQRSVRGGHVDFELDEDLTGAVRALGQARSCTLFMLLTAAFQTLLYRWCGERDIVIGSPVANRARREIEGTIGFFVNNLVLRARVDGRRSFDDLLVQTRNSMPADFENQSFPFDRLVEELHPERSLNRNPIFQVMLVLQNIQETAGSGSGAQQGQSDAAPDGPQFEPGTGTAKFDLLLAVGEQGERIGCAFEYDSDLFDQDTIKSLSERFVCLLRSITAEPGRTLDALPLMAGQQRATILGKWGRGRLPESASFVSVLQQIEQQAGLAPDRLAVNSGPEGLSYGELIRRAGQLAALLEKRGLKEGQTVAVCLERSMDLVVAVLAVHWSGNAYALVDPCLPLDSATTLLAEIDADALLLHALSEHRCPDFDGMRVHLDEDRQELNHSRPQKAPYEPQPYSTACIVADPGSGTSPGRTRVSHQALAQSVGPSARQLFGSCQCIAQATAIFSTFIHIELWGALTRGLTLRIVGADPAMVPREFIEELTAGGVDLLISAPSDIRELLREQVGGLEGLDTLALLGEPLRPSLVADLFAAGRPKRVLHGLDYPEFAGLVSLTELDVDDSRRNWLCVGRPVPGVRAYVLDELGNPVPPGVPGELFLAGNALCGEFHRQPARAAARLLPDPFGEEPGGRLFRTGDRVRWRCDGRLERLGRMDRSVQLRSFRIEPEAIETTLVEHPEIRACAVRPWTFGPDDERLVAYVSARNDVLPTTSELRRFMRARLPAHMVPVLYIEVDAIALTDDGLPDFSRLPTPNLDRPELQEAYVPASSSVETTLHRIWMQVFGLERIGVHDNFFQLGGHSMLAARVIARTADVFGIEVPLRRIFQSPTISSLAQFIEKSLGDTAGPPAPPLVPVDRSGPIPMSFAQQRLWFLDRLQPGSPFYNMPVAMPLRGPIRPDLLEEALREVCHRHEILRTRYIFVDGEPRQIVGTQSGARLEIEDFSDRPLVEARSKAREAATAEAQAVFNLEKGPVLRARLVRVAAEESLLLITVHHIAGDGLSLEILFRELRLFYQAILQGEPAPVAPLRIQYGDYAQWQRSWLSGAVLEEQIGFWRAQLQGSPALHSLPTDRPRPPVQSFRGRIHHFVIHRNLVHRLKELARKLDATLFMAVLAAFKSMLMRFSGQDDIVVGSPVANRPRPQLEPLLGLFVNTLVLRTDLSGSPSFVQALERVRNVVLDAHGHQALPFEQVVEQLQPERHLDRHPLFQISFVLQKPQHGDGGWQGEQHDEQGTDNTIGTARFDLTLAATETDAGLHAAFEYSTDLFDERTIVEMAGVLQTILEQVVERPDERIEELPLGPDRADDTFNDTAVDYGAFRSIPQLIEDQARTRPNATALIGDNAVWTYGQLLEKSGRVAHALRRRGAGRGHAIAVCMERSCERVAVLLGVLRSGAAYVPISVDDPPARVLSMIADAQARAVIGRTTLRALREPMDCPVLEPDELFDEPGDSGAWLPAPAASDPAYIIFTSGSTGRPKGCVNLHQGLRNRLLWMQNYLTLGHDDAVPQKTPYTFDVSVWEFFWPLMAGARLVVARPGGHKDPHYLAGLIDQHQVTCMHFVPSMLRLFLQNPLAPACTSLTRVICSGESLSPELRDSFFQMFDAELHNLYGPTEASIDVSFHACEREWRSAIVPIGRPIANTSMHVLDKAMRHLPACAPGEIYLGGIGLAAGYAGQPRLTAERFVPDPFSTSAGARLYRSGDRGRLLPDGNIEYLGRVDQQVKLRGIRIELDDIEQHMNSHPGVEQAMAAIRESVPGDQRLAAFLVPSAATALPVVAALNGGDDEPAAETVLPNGMAVHITNRAEVDFVYREIFDEQRYLQHGIQIDTARCIVDVGAHVGIFTLFAAMAAPRAKILAFEPAPGPADLLRRNVARYGLDVEVLEHAVGAERGETELTYYPRLSLLSGRYPDADKEKQSLENYLRNTERQLDEIGQRQLDDLLHASLESHRIPCSMVPLSDCIREHAIEQIDLLKIDAERSELDVLRGIDDEHWPLVRQVVLEVHQGQLEGVVGLLKKHGFETVIDKYQALAGTELAEVYASREPLHEEPNAHPVIVPELPYRWCNSEALIEDVRGALRKALPESMVPAEWFMLGDLPRTSSGKLDRRALLLHQGRRVPARSEFRAPRNAVESQMAGIWADVLGVEQVGIDEDFFELGGHSLLAAAVIARFRELLSVELPMRDFFEFSTIAALAEHVNATGMHYEAAPSEPLAGTDLPAIGPLDVENMADEEVTRMLEQLLRQQGATQ